jgi:hypothetical protein
VGDISITQENIELKFPNALTKLNSPGHFVLGARSGFIVARIVRRHLLEPDLILEATDLSDFGGRY